MTRLSLLRLRAKPATIGNSEPDVMSTGSWYGAQIGMTIWLLCLGVIGAVSLDWRLGLAHVVPVSYTHLTLPTILLV